MNYPQTIIDYLKSNPSIDPEGNPIAGPGLNGGIIPLNAIYTRPLKRAEVDDDSGATTEAFSPGGKLIGGIVVTVESMQHHYQFRRIEKAMVINILVHIYTGSHSGGRIMLDDARTRCDLLLENWRFPTTQGTSAVMAWDFNQGTLENHQEFMGSLRDTTRYTINTLRSKEL